MNAVTMSEPRTTTRMAYELLIATAASEGTRADARAGLQWYEMKWNAQDRAAAAAQREALAPKPTPPADPPAVETHGINSPQAQAKRDERKANRLAEEAANQQVADQEAGNAGEGEEDKAGESVEKPVAATTPIPGAMAQSGNSTNAGKKKPRR